MKRGVRVFAAIAVVASLGVGACGKKKPAPPPAAPPPPVEAPRTTLDELFMIGDQLMKAGVKGIAIQTQPAAAGS